MRHNDVKRGRKEFFLIENVSSEFGVVSTPNLERLSVIEELYPFFITLKVFNNEIECVS